MAKVPKKKRPADKDEAQSRRFIEAVRAIGADGGLSPTEAQKRFERLLTAGVRNPPGHNE